MSLVLKDISKSYGRQEVLRQISITIESPKVVGLVGRNGAGKSTLLKILAGIIDPDKGTVIMPETKTTRPLSYMAESNPLYMEMYVFEYLNWVAQSYLQSTSMDDIKHIASEMGLHGIVKKRIGELSKGYRQRVGIAAALIGKPAVCLLDEPINGLDPAQIIEMRQIIRDQGADRIIVLSSHLLQEIEALCDQVWLLEDGQLRDVSKLSSGTAYKIIPRVYRPDMNHLRAIHGVVHFDYAPKHYMIQVADDQVLDNVLQVLLDEGLGVLQLTQVKNSLDSLFLNTATS